MIPICFRSRPLSTIPPSSTNVSTRNYQELCAPKATWAICNAGFFQIAGVLGDRSDDLTWSVFMRRWDLYCEGSGADIAFGHARTSKGETQVKKIAEVLSSWFGLFFLWESCDTNVLFLSLAWKEWHIQGGFGVYSRVCIHTHAEGSHPLRIIPLSQNIN